MVTTLLGLATKELCVLAENEGLPAYRGRQLADWTYHRGVRSFKEMTNLSPEVRSQLQEKYRVGRSRVVKAQRSRDGTTKLLLAMGDGARVETVGLPYRDRLSCCLSTQVGCPIGCVFCATGHGGLTRNLTAGEMVDQVLSVQEAVRKQAGRTHGRSRVDHVVFMGMGEPLLNYDATVKAVRLLNEELGIAMRHLTVSTVGFVPGIRKLATEGLQATLALSLHAPSDALRRRLVPGMKKWSLDEVLDACRLYVLRTGRRLTVEYCLLNGINDGLEEAWELARLLRGFNCHVNLIPYNEVSGLPFQGSSPDRIRGFRQVLEAAGIPVTQRVQRGDDIDAACGQLRRREAESKAAV